MPRPALLSAALVLTALPVLAAAPAQAAAGTYCVNMATGCPTGGIPIGTIQAAITAQAETILVGPGTYKDGPYTLGAGMTIQGSGAGTGVSSTVLTRDVAPAGPYVTANGSGATLRQLSIQMASPSAGGVGLSLANGAIVRNVRVIGSGGSTGAVGVEATNSRIEMLTVNLTQATGTIGVHAQGGNIVLDSTLNAETAYRQDSATNDTVARGIFRGTVTGAEVRSGTLTIDNSQFELGAGGTVGLTAAPPAGASPSATIKATQLTVVGGATGSRGVWANAA
jgi:hypothetical protein